jgi:hypothetical protein
MNNLIDRQRISQVLVLLSIVVFWTNSAYLQNKPKTGKPVPEAFCIKPQEQFLFGKINELRQKNDLPVIALSNSLCYVAARHVRDLTLYHPDEGNCNFHSWSGNGPWTAFCYPRDENKKQSVWDKPKEITKYPSKAYEMIYWENVELTPDSVMAVWLSEEHYRNYLLNQGKWSEYTWKSVGVAILGNYACAWFGAEDDPEGPAWVCGSIRKPPVKKDTISNKAEKTSPQPIAVIEKKDTTLAGTGKSTDTGWYVIVKTNLTDAAAAKVVQELNAAGYPNATILKKNGKTRISAFGPVDKPSAAQKLKTIKATYSDAWLLKQ